LAQVRYLADQWQQLVGFNVQIGDDIIQAMSDANVQSLYDIGQWMETHGQGPGQTGIVGVNGIFPWATYGLSHDDYQRMFSSIGDTYMGLTGQSLDAGLFDKYLRRTRATLSGAELRTFLLNDPAMLNQFGWLRYGLDFQQFQQQKLQMHQAFGQVAELTDQQAVQQLQYFHSAQGSNQGAAVQPTLSQIERKQAQQGVSGNVVR